MTENAAGEEEQQCRTQARNLPGKTPLWQTESVAVTLPTNSPFGRYVNGYDHAQCGHDRVHGQRQVDPCWSSSPRSTAARHPIVSVEASRLARSASRRVRP